MGGEGWEGSVSGLVGLRRGLLTLFGHCCRDGLDEALLGLEGALCVGVVVLWGRDRRLIGSEAGRNSR